MTRAALRVLVTRPAADAAPLVAELRARGYAPLAVPLLEIHDSAKPDDIDLTEAQALLFTSANGLRALVRTCPEAPALVGDRPLYLVGPASTALARDLGFRKLVTAGGDAAALRDLVVEELRPADGPLWYGQGRDKRFGLAAELEAAGFKIQGVTLYHAEVPENLPPAIATALDQKTLDAVSFFSPRTAASFARLVAAAQRSEACRGCLALCLSAAVAREIETLPWAAVLVAERPEQPALLAALDRWRRDREHARQSLTP